MSKRPPGLQYDKETKEWSIDKKIRGERIRKRLRSRTQQEAEIEFYNYLSTFGQTREEGRLTFKEAGLRYIREATKKSIDRDVVTLKAIDPYIGNLSLSDVHMGTLQEFIEHRRNAGIKSATVKRDLAVVHAILILACGTWRNVFGEPYLSNMPVFKPPNWEDSAQPYPLEISEQIKLFNELPNHLSVMCLFAVNTGIREQGVCWLRWDWEVKIPELNTSIFITPGRKRQFEDGAWPGEKNKEDQIIVLNRIARKVIDGQRGNGSEYVFTYNDRRLTRIHNSAWKKAWLRSGLPGGKEYNRGPHNLKHTFGRRLRNAGVSLETRKVLLHHKSADITTHYSPADIIELIDAVEKIVDAKPCQILRRVV